MRRVDEEMKKRERLEAEKHKVTRDDRKKDDEEKDDQKALEECERYALNFLPKQYISSLLASRLKLRLNKFVIRISFTKYSKWKFWHFEPLCLR